MPKKPGKRKLVKDSESEASSSGDDRELCKYGAKCYRKNPDDLKRFKHPRVKKRKPKSKKKKTKKNRKIAVVSSREDEEDKEEEEEEEEENLFASDSSDGGKTHKIKGKKKKKKTKTKSKKYHAPLRSDTDDFARALESQAGDQQEQQEPLRPTIYLLTKSPHYPFDANEAVERYEVGCDLNLPFKLPPNAPALAYAASFAKDMQKVLRGQEHYYGDGSASFEAVIITVPNDFLKPCDPAVLTAHRLRKSTLADTLAGYGIPSDIVEIVEAYGPPFIRTVQNLNEVTNVVVEGLVPSEYTPSIQTINLADTSTHAHGILKYFCPDDGAYQYVLEEAEEQPEALHAYQRASASFLARFPQVFMVKSRNDDEDGYHTKLLLGLVSMGDTCLFAGVWCCYFG